MKEHVPPRLRAQYRTTRRLWDYWVTPVFSISRIFNALTGYWRYSADWVRYRRLAGAEPLHLHDSHPSLFDKVANTSYEPHYFYQAVWAMERIARTGVQLHVDIGSDIDFVGMLTSHVPVVFLDIRPLAARLARLQSASADILHLPFAAGSIYSLSCLHVAEHIGLGRYGDELNPLGTRQACAEPVRSLSPKGNLFFSLPIGRPRVCFNAHRVHSQNEILDYFTGLELVEFSAVDDDGNLRIGVLPNQIENAEYACGLFWFRKIS